MAPVRGPSAARAREAGAAQRRAAPLVSQEWLIGSAQKIVKSLDKASFTASEGRGGAACVYDNGLPMAGHVLDAAAMLHALRKQVLALEETSRYNAIPAVPMKTVCTSCGTNCKEGYKFCAFCGAPVKKVAAAEPKIEKAAKVHGGKVAKVQTSKETEVSPSAGVQQTHGSANNASCHVSGGAAVSPMRPCPPAPPTDASLSRGLQMKPRVNAYHTSASRSSKKHLLTTIAESSEEEDEEKENQEVKNGSQQAVF